MAVDLTKHDVAINSVGYRLGSYIKREASSFVPRFNTGAENENHLDFWKEISISDFRGGAFQKKWDKDDAAFFVVGAPDQRTGQLRSVPVEAAIGSYTNNGQRLSAWTVFNGDIYFACDNNAGASSTSTFRKLASSNDAVTTPSGYPAALSTNNYITDMVTFEDKIYFASKTGNIQQWDGTTWTAHSTRLEKLCVFRDTLYGIAEDGGLHSLSGTTWTLIKRFGEKAATTNAPNKMVEFNSRLYIGKPEGLYAYDGVQVVRVIDFSKNQYSNNFKYMTGHQGWLYYNINNVLHRFNGVTVEKLFQDDNYSFYDMLSAGEDLYLMVYAAGLYGYTAFGSITDIDYLKPYVLRFDGVSFTYFAQFSESVFNSTSFRMMYQNRKLYLEKGYVTGGSTSDIIKKIPIDLTALSTAQWIEYISSEFTASLPEVMKYLHKIDITFSKPYGSGTPAIDATLVFLDSGYTITLGAQSSSLTNSYNIFENYGGLLDNANYSTERMVIVIHAEVPSGTALTLDDISLRYAIMPEYRNSWTLNLLCFGTSTEPLMLKDGTDETVTAAALRENLYDARRQYNPVEFVDVDYDLLSGAHNNSVTTITATDTNTFPESGILLIGSEKIKYTGKTASTFTGCTRGYLGSSAASHTDQDKIYCVYLTAVTKIVNERILLESESTVTSGGKWVSELQVELEQAS